MQFPLIDHGVAAGSWPPPPPGWPWTPPAEGRRYDIRPAATMHQRRAAGALVRRMYAWRGYGAGTTGPAPADGCRVVLAAWQGDEVLATLTLGRDSPSGLLGEALYPEEIGRLRRPRRILCEVSRLAVDPDFRSPELLADLFRAAHRYARWVFAATDAVIEVNPRHARYYERQFGFRQIGGLRRCPRVEAPAVLLHRELKALAALDFAGRNDQRFSPPPAALDER